MNFLNGAGAYQHPVEDAEICAVFTGNHLEFYVFYKAGIPGQSAGGWGWKLATEPDDAMNFLNGARAYQHPVKEAKICAVSKGSHLEFYIFYR
jgi:hypothetical protein